MKYDLFVSHSHRDRTWVRRFVDSLKVRGLRVWSDIEGPHPGRDLSAVIRRGVRQSMFVVVVLDPQYPANPNVFFEAGLAIGLGRRVIFIAPEEGPLLPSDLQARLRVVRGTPASTANQVLETVRSHHK